MTENPSTEAPTRRTEYSAAANVGLLALRLMVGVGMAAHGAQKLFGLFNGDGLDGTADFFASVGYEPGRTFAILSGLAEFGGGLLLILGLAVPLAGAAIVANMTGAYSVVQEAAPGDFFAVTGGPELELFYIVTAFGLILTGAGSLGLRINALDGPKMRLLGVLLAIGGGVAAVLVRNL